MTVEYRTQDLHGDSSQPDIAVDLDTLLRPRPCAGLNLLRLVREPARLRRVPSQPESSSPGELSVNTHLEQTKGDAEDNADEPELVGELSDACSGAWGKVPELD